MLSFKILIFLSIYIVAGDQSGHEYNCSGFNDTEIEDFPQGFMEDDPSEHFLDEDLTTSPSFEVVEDIKVNHGMLVSTRQVANTFFHQTLPSQTVKVHQNPITATTFHYFHMGKECNNNKGKSFFGKFNNAFAKAKCLETITFTTPPASAFLCMVMLLLMHSFCVEEDIINEKLVAGLRPRDAVLSTVKAKEKYVLVKGSGWNDLGLILKKLVFFFTISLALGTLLASTLY